MSDPIPPPTDDDLRFDLELFYRYLSGELDVYATGTNVGDIAPSSRGLIRRLVAAEAENVRLRMVQACLRDELVEHAAALERQRDEQIADKHRILREYEDAMNRRLVAAEANADRYRELNAKLGCRLAEIPAWLKVILPHLTGECGCRYPTICDEKVVRAVKDAAGVK